MKIKEGFYDGGEDTNNDIYDQVKVDSRKPYIWAGALVAALAVGGAAAATTHAWVTKNAKIEAKNSLNEGQLRERGFDENGILIDVSGDTDVITIGCPGTVLESTEKDQTSISFIYNSETMTASWDVAPQEDQSGQVVETFPSIEFPLSTEFEVVSFIDEDLVRACSAVESN